MMSMNSKQPHFAMHPSLPEPKYTTLHSSSEAIRRACLQAPQVNYTATKNLHSCCRVGAAPLRGASSQDALLLLLLLVFIPAISSSREKKNSFSEFTAGTLGFLILI